LPACSPSRSFSEAKAQAGYFIGHWTLEFEHLFVITPTAFNKQIIPKNQRFCKKIKKQGLINKNFF
jgi:hypothetical protein